MKIIIADDHQLYREALSILMQRLDRDIEIRFASNFTELLQLVEPSDSWDLILVDLNMPGLAYYDGIKQLASKQPHTPITVITSSENPQDSKRALQAGALGYMSKAMKSEDMLIAIKLILNHGISIHPNHEHTTTKIAPEKNTVVFKQLTPRQQQVLKQLCQGESNKRIALNLGLSEHTVKLHVRAILSTLSVKNRTQAVIVAKNLFLSELNSI